MGENLPFRHQLMESLLRERRLVRIGTHFRRLLEVAVAHTTAMASGLRQVASCCSLGVALASGRLAVFRLRTRATVSRPRGRTSALAWLSTETRQS